MAGIDVGGKRPADAVDLLRKRLAAFEPNPVVLRHGERSWAPAADELGLETDYDATIASIRQPRLTGIGRRLRSAIDPAYPRRVEPIAIRIDPARLRGYLDGLNGEVSMPPGEALPIIDGAVATVAGGRAGTEIDRDAAVRGNDLVAELYGPSTGYEVRLGDPEFGVPVSPPLAIEREDDGLAAGSWATVRPSQPGITVRVRGRIINSGAVLVEDTFVSPYRPQAEVVLLGVAES